MFLSSEKKRWARVNIDQYQPVMPQDQIFEESWDEIHAEAPASY